MLGQSHKGFLTWQRCATVAVVATLLVAILSSVDKQPTTAEVWTLIDVEKHANLYLRSPSSAPELL